MENVLITRGEGSGQIANRSHSAIRAVPASPEDGGKFRVYEQQVSAKMVDLTVEHYSNVLVTSSVGLRKLTIS